MSRPSHNGNTVDRGSIISIRCLIVLSFGESTDHVTMPAVSPNTPWWPFFNQVTRVLYPHIQNDAFQVK